MEEISKGDVVWLKSGGPAMTAENAGSYSHSAGPADGVFCVWFEDKKKKAALFDRAVLTKIDPN